MSALEYFYQLESRRIVYGIVDETVFLVSNPYCDECYEDRVVQDVSKMEIFIQTYPFNFLRQDYIVDLERCGKKKTDLQQKPYLWFPNKNSKS